MEESRGYLSYLMGADSITDEDLERAGVKIVERFDSGIRGVEVPDSAADRYKELVRQSLSPGYWNELVGPHDIVFLFKSEDGSVEEIPYSAQTEQRIARLCAQYNNDPLEATSDIPRYLSGNSFYRELIARFYR